MKLLGEKTKHVWHLRVQRWTWRGRTRCQAYRFNATSLEDAADQLYKRLGTVRGVVVTRAREGKLLRP